MNTTDRRWAKSVCAWEAMAEKEKGTRTRIHRWTVLFLIEVRSEEDALTVDGNVHANFFTVKGKYSYAYSGINYKTEPMKTHIQRISERIRMDNVQCTKQWYTTRKMKWQIDTPCIYRAACIYHTVFSIHTHKANDFFLSGAFFSPPTKKTLHDSPRDIFLYCFLFSFHFSPFHCRRRRRSLIVYAFCAAIQNSIYKEMKMRTRLPSKR